MVPDVPVPQEQAFDVAYATALRHVLARDELFPPIADGAREALAALPGTEPSAATASSATASSATGASAVTE